MAEPDVPGTRRPTPERAGRAAKIETLVDVLVEHLRAARDHAFTTRDRAGGPTLLPRPSQQQLAALTGLSESDVSRCLKDRTARELRILWEIALDVDQIMNWRGRPHARHE